MSSTTSENGKMEKSKVVSKHDFEFRGTKFVIPQGLDYPGAIEALRKQHAEEQVVVQVNEPIRAFPMDGAAAMMRVLQRRYGWQNLLPTPGFWGSSPPTMISVEIGPDERVQVPWGRCSVPYVEGYIYTGFDVEDGACIFSLRAEVKRLSEKVVAEIAQEVREEVRTHSIYRGKAIKVNYRDSDGDRVSFHPSYCPKFIKLPSDSDVPIFSKAVEQAVQINLFNPVMHSEQCRQNGVSLKRGVMLSGPYGGGKTLLAHTLAKTCVQSGWTFLYLEDVRDLDLAVGLAKMYQPCVIFAEDIDRATNGPRDANMDRLLNTLDGIEAKQKNEGLIVVLTTNHLGSINPAFVRPGRIDAVIEIGPPDQNACVRLVKKYAADGNCSLACTEDEAGAAIRCLVGANASFFRVVVEQAKLAAISTSEAGKPLTIGVAELESAANAMLPHAILINPEHGRKSLEQLMGEGSQMLDPMTVATDILMQKMSEAFFDQIANPKKLAGIITKSMKRPRGGSFGDN